MKIVILRCNKTMLYDRLAARGYKKEKINESLVCEILEFSNEDAHCRYKKEIVM
jgi:adenylate kinase